MPALLPVAALLALPLTAGTGHATAAPDSAPRPPAVTAAAAEAPAAARAEITEGQVKEVGPGGTLFYPSVTSCLTVTVRLADGGLVGAHASLFQVPGEYRSDQILAALKKQVGDRAVRAVEVKGAVGAWDPSYFTKALESYGDGEDVPFPTEPDPAGIADAVAKGTGQPKGKVTVEDVPDGDLTIK